VAPPRSLGAWEQKRYLRAAERRPNARDRAIARLLFYTGLRVGELAALDTDDVAVSARKGLITVRSGKGSKTRGVPLVNP
jgi:site-specific recombinase XerC